MAEELLVVLTTVDRKETAESIARQLVNNHLAACVQVLGPIRSFYRWKNQLEEAEEWQCLVKTRKSLWPAVLEAIKASHPYELPEIIATSVAEGFDPYLRWAITETQAK